MALLVVGVGVAALLLSRSSTTSTTRDADWVAAANAYCRTTTDPDLKAAQQMGSSAPDRAALAVAAVNRQLDSYLRSSPPASLATQVAQITSDWDRYASLLEQSAAAYRAGDTATAQNDVTQGSSVNDAGNQLAQQIGLRDCAAAGSLTG